MDTFLAKYLRSGRAWVLVGSGPSIQAGYPTWAQLASSAAKLVARDAPGKSAGIDRATQAGDFPRVLDEAASLVGMPSLLSHLREDFVRSVDGSLRIYDLLSRWPVDVFLTTNYDDELAGRLANVDSAFRTYTNSEDHMSLLVDGLSGAVVKLHGDLTSAQGLVLTSSQYTALERAPEWQYWRNKMQAVFMQQPVIIVGHSLTDPNIRAILQAARVGSGVVQPVCWLAPNVVRADAQRYLEKYRIRVVPYEDLDGTHRYLENLVRDVSRFAPARTSIRPTPATAAILKNTSNSDAAAALCVFARMAGQAGFDERKREAMLALIEASVPGLGTGDYSAEQILNAAGWKEESLLPEVVATDLLQSAVKRGLLVARDGRYRAAPETNASRQQKASFCHLQDRFREALRLRLRREFPTLPDGQCVRLATDIDLALVGYFKRGGLTLATILLAREDATKPLPTSILDFIMDAANQYPDPLSRQAFSDVSVSIFIEGGDAERDYLGRLAQGFLGATILGYFGSLAVQRLASARSTVWLIDSNVQIPAVALLAPSNSSFQDSLKRLSDKGVRLFTTEKLFEETVEHLRYAQDVVAHHGETSPNVIAGAQGNPPYRSQNQFLQGYVNWRASDQPEWEAYLFAAFGSREPTPDDVRSSLRTVGLEVVHFSDWPGFDNMAYQDRQAAFEQLWSITMERGGGFYANEPKKLEHKIQPEAEAFVVVDHERSGRFCMLSRPGEPTPANFVSSTSQLNLMAPKKVTWQPEMFLQFANAMLSDYAPGSSDRAFDLVLWNLAQSGVTVLPEMSVKAAFGGVIDQASLVTADQEQAYQAVLESKYGESREAVLAQVPYSDRAMAALQLANEVVETQARVMADLADSKTNVEARAAAESRRADKAEGTLSKVVRYKHKLDDKQARGVKRERRTAAQPHGGKKRRK